jgi:hypothetical protein
MWDDLSSSSLFLLFSSSSFLLSFGKDLVLSYARIGTSPSRDRVGSIARAAALPEVLTHAEVGQELPYAYARMAMG